MSLRENLGNSVRGYGFDGKKKSRIFTRAYDRFFEGYTEEAVLKPNGKGIKIRRIYKSNYYVQDLSSNKKFLLRALYVLLFILSVYLFASAAITPILSNTTWYVTVCQALCVPMLFWILFTFVSYLPAPKKMTISEFKSSSISLKRASAAAAIALAVLSVSMIVFILLNLLGKDSSKELICLLKYLCSAASSSLIFFIEKKVKYAVVPAKAKSSAPQL